MMSLGGVGKGLLSLELSLQIFLQCMLLVSSKPSEIAHCHPQLLEWFRCCNQMHPYLKYNKGTRTRLVVKLTSCVSLLTDSSVVHALTCVLLAAPLNHYLCYFETGMTK